MTNETHASPIVVGSEDRGERGRRAFVHPVPADPTTFHAVSKVRLDPRGRVTYVVWGQVNTTTNTWATDEAFAAVEDVVDALHKGDPVFALFPGEAGHVPERRFVATLHDDGLETIALDNASSPGRPVDAMDRIA